MSDPIESTTDNTPAVSRRGFLTTSVALAGAGTLVEETARAAQRAVTTGSTTHPLDPLIGPELLDAVKVLRESKQLGEAHRFISITLLEPTKQVLRGPQSGSAIPRQALVVLLDSSKKAAFEAVVDLTARTVNRLTQLPEGVQPSISLDESNEVEELAKRSPEFQAVLKKRGVKEDPSLVMVDAWSAGRYGNEPPDLKGRRFVRALCFVRAEPKDNGYARPLDGVVVLFDLHEKKIHRIEEYGPPVPVPPERSNWAREYLTKPRTDLRPLEVVQREGPSFAVDGREVRWQKWRFRLGYTPREGLVLHTIRYDDDGRERPIIHRASMSEMVVPYADPGEQYYRKNAFDIGEYNVGTLATSLSLGCDCLGPTRYFDAEVIKTNGEVTTIKNAVCLHEEDVGILWKHTDGRVDQSEVRRSRRLSVSFIATVGNYDYAYYWYFYQDGSIQCEVKLTGILNASALRKGQKPAWGVEVAPQVSAPFHQHIFAARLHMAVDGDRNSIYEVNTISQPWSAANPHGNAFRAQATHLQTEKQARRTVNGASGRFWRIVNPNSKNRLGNPVAYRLLPGENSPAFVQPDSPIMQRAGFARYHLWVTPFHPEERFAAGEYPNQHPTGDGLPRWTEANRSIDNTDVVVWYVFATNHVPRPEDWPVMPASAIGFHLKPDGFFARNPALDVPPPPVA